MIAAALVMITVFGGVSARGDVAVTPHQEAINQATTNGLEWLADNQRPDGSWDAAGDNYVGGAAFGAMAFMAQGYTEASLHNGRPVVADALDFILSQRKTAGWQGLNDTAGSIFWGGDPPDPERIHHANYETSVAVMALAMADAMYYAGDIAAAAAWLDKNQWDDQYPNKVGDPEWSVWDDYFGGFGYQCMVPQDERWDARPDLSNTHLSILALHAAGALNSSIADDALTFIANCQGAQRDTLVNLFRTDESCARNVVWSPAGTAIAYNSNHEDPWAGCALYAQDVVPGQVPILDPAFASISWASYSAAAGKVGLYGDPGTGEADV